VEKLSQREERENNKSLIKRGSLNFAHRSKPKNSALGIVEGKGMNEHEKINYIELPARDIEATKDFFTTVFGWSFLDYGHEYAAFENAGIDGGFFKSNVSASSENGSVLIVFYSRDLEQTQAKIERAGGPIVKPLFSFPGGRRFHFADPSGNEYAVWSDLNA